MCINMHMEKVRASVAGASGYAGGELVRWLMHHPAAEVVHVTAFREQGRPLADLAGRPCPIAAAMTFYAAGRMYRTDWFRSHIVVREGRIISLEPSNMPARRVRAPRFLRTRTPAFDRAPRAML